MSIIEINIYPRVFTDLCYDPIAEDYIGIRDYTAINNIPAYVHAAFKTACDEDEKNIFDNHFDSSGDISKSLDHCVMNPKSDAVKSIIFSLHRKYWEDILRRYKQEIRNLDPIIDKDWEDYEQLIQSNPLTGEKNTNILSDFTCQIKEKYIDIFRQAENNDTVYLRAEYYADSNGKFHPVPVRNLSDSREPQNGSGSEYITIPHNQKCFILLSDIKLSCLRLENIRRSIEKGLIPPRMLQISPLYDLIKEDDIAGNNNKFLKNSLYREDGKRYLLLTDHIGYAKALKEKYVSASKKYNEITGKDNDNKDKQLLSLVASTCGRRKDKPYWNCISEDKLDKVKEAWREVESFSVLREQSGKECVKWLTSNRLNDAIYDYYIASDNKAGEVFTDLLDGLEECDSAKEILNTYFEKAMIEFQKSYNKACNANNISNNYPQLNNSDVDINYWEGNIDISRPFRSKELTYYSIYEFSAKKFFVVEELYSNFKKVRKVTDKVLKIFASSIAKHSDSRLRLNLNYIKAVFTRNLPNSSVKVTNISKIIDEAIKADNNILNSQWNTEALSYKVLKCRAYSELTKAVAVINVLLSIDALLQENSNIPRSSVELVANVCSIIDAFKVIDNVKTRGAMGRILRRGAGHSISNAWNAAYIILGIMDYNELSKKNDKDAAIVKGGSQVIAGVIGLISTAYPPVALAGVLIGVVGGIWAEYLTDDEYMDWLQFSQYGKEYDEAIKNNNNYNNWQVLNSVNNSTKPLYTTDDYIPAWSNYFSDWNMPESQLISYAKIAFEFELVVPSDHIVRNFPKQEGQGKMYEIEHLEVFIFATNFDPYAKYELDFIIDDNIINNDTIVLNQNNAAKEYNEKINQTIVKYTLSMATNSSLLEEINKLLISNLCDFKITASLNRNDDRILTHYKEIHPDITVNESSFDLNLINLP